METSLSNSEYPQKINVDLLETIIMLIDSNYRILDMNESAQKMFAVGDSRRKKLHFRQYYSLPTKTTGAHRYSH